MSEGKRTPITDDAFIMGYKVGTGFHGTIEDANKAIRRGDGDSWIPLYRKNHLGPELLEALECVWDDMCTSPTSKISKKTALMVRAVIVKAGGKL